MNKKQLVAEIADKASLSQKDAHEFLDNFVELVKRRLSKGEEISIVDFGSFSVAERAARTTCNFKTGKPMDVPASKTVKFRPGKSLKESANS